MTTRAAQLLTEALTSYQTDGTMYKPGMDTAKKLDAGIYAIKSSMQGIFFEKKTLVQDSVMKFRDPRLVEILKEADKFWELEKNFKELGLIHKRGMLLYGPPGVGKSVLMSQVAEDAIKKDAVVFYAGEPQLASAALKEFREVEPTRNAVCIFDDIDSVLYQEKALLGLLDGENKINHVLFIATTNYLERFPARLLRSGRFDSKTEVLTPPEEGRRAFFKAKVKGIDEQTLSSAVQATEGFSFAQMREVLASVFAYGRDLNREVDRIRKGDPVQTSGTAGRPSLYQTEGKVKQILGVYEEYDIDLIQEEMKDMKEDDGLVKQTRARRLLESIRGITEAKGVTLLITQGSVEGTYLIQIPAGGPKDLVKDVEASITNSPNYSLVDTSAVKVNGKSHMQVRIRSKHRDILAGVAIDIRPTMTDIDGVKTLVSVEK